MVVLSVTHVLLILLFLALL